MNKLEAFAYRYRKVCQDFPNNEDACVKAQSMVLEINRVYPCVSNGKINTGNMNKVLDVMLGVSNNMGIAR